MSGSVKWRNRARFKGKLKDLPPTIFAAARGALEDQAGEIVGAMQRLVPVHTGKLRNSIGWTYGDAPKDAKLLAVFRKPRGKSDSKITIFAGSFAAYWARWVEFGTKARAPGKYRDEKNKRRNAGKRGHKATKAQPFFWVTWNSMKRSVRGKITRKTNAAIKALAASSGGNGGD
jgi:HK97 gp10 family phage protein